MPVRFARKEEAIEKPELAETITLADFQKKLDQWEPITLRLLQNIISTGGKLSDFEALIEEGAVTGAEMRGWLNVNLRLPLEAYQKTIYTSYKVFLQSVAAEFAEARTREAQTLARQAAGILNTLKHFDITYRIIISVCENVFKIPGSLKEQFEGLNKVLPSRLAELQKYVTQQHEDMHALAMQYRAVKALAAAQLRKEIEEATSV
jgi:hypothetical protein